LEHIAPWPGAEVAIYRSIDQGMCWIMFVLVRRKSEKHMGGGAKLINVGKTIINHHPNHQK
jgi:hypothetical protein